MLHELKGFLDEDLCQSFTTYALRERLNNFHSYGKDLPTTHGVYKDSFAEACLYSFQERVQKYFKEDIHPTYSFYIVYENGHHLNKHIDSDACEISITIHAGHLYGDSYQGTVWPLYIDDIPIYSNVGDALLYDQKAKKYEHWREPFNGVYQIQLLLHYVTGSIDKIPIPIEKLIFTA
jgi:hypothetical protein|tara:strand:+ start:1730 stop:2263 length:534 start_codon:yes stop_codon:yes gene_type:complete